MHLADLDAVRAALRPGVTRLSGPETPTNPLLGIADIAALAEIAHAADALLVVDNTFATPYLQNPLALGADLVVHSTTKYCGGHSDVVGGALIVRDAASVRGWTAPGRRPAIWTSGSASTRTRWEPSPARSTPGWSSAD